MDNNPKTRQEKRKDPKQKGRPDKLGTSKHIRAVEALRERTSGQNNNKKQTQTFFSSELKI